MYSSERANIVHLQALREFPNESSVHRMRYTWRDRQLRERKTLRIKRTRFMLKHFKSEFALCPTYQVRSVSLAANEILGKLICNSSE